MTAPAVVLTKQPGKQPVVLSKHVVNLISLVIYDVDPLATDST